MGEVWMTIRALAVPILIALFLIGAIAAPFIEKLIPDKVGYETRDDPSPGPNSLPSPPSNPYSRIIEGEDDDRRETRPADA